MHNRSHERGQALILIVFAIIVLVGLTGLVVDGGLAYSDRRRAQNAADNAALAAALAYVRGGNVQAVALSSALTNGFDNNGTSNTVSVGTASSGHCPYNGSGEDVTVQITSRLSTYFAPVIGIRRLSNTVQATARSCSPYVGPLFNGNAIVALAPGGIGFDAAGTPNWIVTGGGIFSNSSDAPSARCKGASDVASPSLTAVGTVAAQCSTEVALTMTGASQYTYSDYAPLLPRVPACNGIARKQGPYWTAQAGADGSRVAFAGNMIFAPGLLCVTNSPGPFHGQIYGAYDTFYLMPPSFAFKLNGGGTFDATAPSGGEYAGVLMFSAPQLNGGTLLDTQSIDLPGNGSSTVPTGSIIVPSASVTMFGNSGTSGYETQVIAYNVDSGGTSNININYNTTQGYQTTYPAWLTLLK